MARRPIKTKDWERFIITHKCKSGNSESAEAIFARESNGFVADKLSDLNKREKIKCKMG